MKTKIMQLLETTMVDDGDQLLMINKDEIPELAERIVKLFAIPDVIKCPNCGSYEAGKPNEYDYTCLDCNHKFN